MTNTEQPVIIPDPEMVLPDEQLPAHTQINAVSELFGGLYPSVAALIRARTRVEWQLNAYITEEQRNRCVPGCWAWFEVDRGEGRKRLPVFGEIPDVEDLTKSERVADIRDAWARRLRRRISDAHRRGWLFGQWFSIAAPKGEWGAMHMSMLEPMLQESFLAAQAKKWTFDSAI